MVGETILIVDDEEHIRRLCTEILKRNSYQTVAVASAEGKGSCFAVWLPMIFVRLSTALVKSTSTDLVRANPQNPPANPASKKQAR